MNIVTKEQSDMIDLILSGHTVTDIAKNHIKLHPSTLYRWLERVEIKAELEERKRALRKASRDKITGNVSNLVDKMLDLANNSTDQRVRYNAIKYLLDQSIGTATTYKEDILSDGVDDDKDNKSTLEKELESIKNLKVVK